jgi:hypothetical protein
MASFGVSPCAGLALHLAKQGVEMAEQANLMPPPTTSAWEETGSKALRTPWKFRTGPRLLLPAFQIEIGFLFHK